MNSLVPIPTGASPSFPIRISASSDSSPLFSIQDALSTYSGLKNTNAPLDMPNEGSGTLFRSGCVVDGIINCTAACQDVNQIFADPHTFQNCMVVASLPVLGSIVYLDNSSVLLTEVFIPVDEPSFESLASGVNQTIQDCLTQYLEKDPGSDKQWSPWYIEQEDIELTAFSSFPSFCNNLTSVPLNADVGGIGVREYVVLEKTDAYAWQVYISYWLQGAISLSAFLALKLCDKLPYPTRLRRLLPALKSATVEFHKAQCFVSSCSQSILRLRLY